MVINVDKGRIARDRPPKIARFHGGIELPHNTWFNGSIRVHMENGIEINSVVLAQVMAVSSRQTRTQTTELGNNGPLFVM